VALFASQLQEEVLVEVPHRQYVFTIHKLLRQHFRFDDRHQSGFLAQGGVLCQPGSIYINAITAGNARADNFQVCVGK
jgi:hypothetical protein